MDRPSDELGGTNDNHGCQIAKFDPFLSLDQGGGRGGGIQGKEGIKFCSAGIVLQHIYSYNHLATMMNDETSKFLDSHFHNLILSCEA